MQVPQKAHLIGFGHFLKLFFCTRIFIHIWMKLFSQLRNKNMHFYVKWSTQRYANLCLQMTTMTRTWGVHTRSINDRHLATINSGDHVEMFRSRVSAGFYTSRRSSRANDECKSTTNVISASRSEISRHLLEMIFMPLLSVQHVSVTMFFFVVPANISALRMFFSL